MVKALIVAAGMGRRLEGYIGDSPKSLINLRDKRIIEKQIEILKESGVDDIAIVVGYQRQKIMEVLGDKVVYYYNPFFETTNSVVSMWLAKDFFKGKEEIVVMNSDILIESQVIKDLIKSPNDFCVVVDLGRYNKLGYKVKIIDESVVEMGMDIKEGEVAGEYAGVSKFSTKTVPLLNKVLDQFMEDKKFNVWYETAYVQMISEGTKISYIDVDKKCWVELDTPDDIEKVRQYFN